MRMSSGVLKWVLGGAAAALLLCTAPVWAAHKGYETSCYVCHTLNPSDGEPGTSFIYSLAKTLPQMKTTLGVPTWDNLSTPRNFGCTFCHSSLSTHGAPMAAILFDFSSQQYKHPVGVNYLTGVNNENEYISSGKSETGYFRVSSGPAVNVAGSLECIACHDPALVTYPNHDNNWVASKGANTYALRSFSGADNNARWNGFCSTLCHNYTASGTDNNQILSSGKSAHGITAGDISPSQKGNCRSCHSGHFADQDDLISSAVATTATCDRCHTKSNYSGTGSMFTGPDNTAYYTGGHGKVQNEAGSAINLPCTNCHKATSTSDNTSRHALPVPGSAASMSPAKNPKMSFPYSATNGPCYPCHTTDHLHHGQTYDPSGIPKGACLTCHEPHGGGQGFSTDNNRKMIRTKIDVPANGAPAPYTYAFGTTASGNNQTVAFRAKSGSVASYNPGGDNTGNSSGVCVVCHDNAPTSSSAFRYIAGHGGGNQKDTNCFSCHAKTGGGTSTGFGGFPPPACNGCHSAPPLDLTMMVHQVHDRLHSATNPPLGYGDTGNSSTATQYSFGCGICHSGTHRDGVSGSGTDADPWRVQVVFAASVNPGGAYTENATTVNDIGPNGESFRYSLGTCGNLYCHSNAQPLNGATVYAPIQFSTLAKTSPNNCRVCHGNNDSAAPTVGRTGGANKGGSPAHVKHINGATYAYSCVRCHALTVSADNVILDKTQHVDGVKTVAFDSYNTGGGFDNTHSCSATYCHSRGTSFSGSFAAGVKTPSWDNASPNGQIDCNSCHGGAGQTGIAMGMPSYATGTPKANSHVSHVQSRGYACRFCHAKVTTTGTSIDNAALHVNKAYNVDPSAADLVSFTYNGGSGSCSAISCHGGASATWGNAASADCRDCHGRSTAAGGDRDNFLYGDGTISYIDNEVWGGTNSGTGHGRSGTGTVYNSGNKPANNSVTPGIFGTCTTNCHTTAIPHGTAANPFRLTTKGTTPITDFTDGALNPQTQQQKENTVCLDCHDGVNGVNKAYVFSAYVGENHFGAKHGTDQTKGGTFCWDCHDPHGDVNDYMIHDNVTVKSDGQYGVPDNAAGSRAAVVFRGNLGDNTTLGPPSGFDWADYATVSRNGICQVCHTATSYFLASTWTAADASHNKSGAPSPRCTTCHDHNRDFAASCSGCHGYPPLDNTVVPGPGNYQDGKIQDYAGGGGAHKATDHVSPAVVATDSWTPCLKCHPNGNHAQGGQTVLRTNVQLAIDNTYKAKPAGTPTYAGGAAWTCSNVSCHGGQTTPRWDNGAINANTQCAVCHIRENVANRAAATQFQSAITGLHAVTTTVSGKDHWADAAATCGGATACHTAQPANHFGANLLDNAVIELTTANAGLRAGITVATGAPHDPNLDTCAVACHMDGGNWARLNDKAKATASIDNAVVCSTCHGTFATGWTAGAGVLTRPNMTSVGGPAALTGGHDNNWDGDGTPGEVSPNHSVCKTCHGMNARLDNNANYKSGANLWYPTDGVSDHGNGRITMNGPSAAINAANNAVPAGAEYNGNDDNTLESSDWSCTKACHSGAANASHNMGRSSAGWPVQYGDFGAGACSSCHGSDALGQYWPVGAPGAYPNRKGAHDNHVDTIGSWLYAETAATGLLSDSAKGASAAKQIAICSWCHPDPGNPRPGTGEASHADYVPPADVHGDGRSGASASYLRYFNGNLAVPGSDNDTGATYNSATQSCSTAKCHNNNPTPVSPNGWTNPPAWTATNCSSTQCHATPASSGAHATHYTTKGYACSECHVVPSSIRHLNGQVNLSFAGLEATYGGGNGFYDKDNTGVAASTAGDNDFKAYDNVYNRSCANIYCHGGDNGWGGTDNTPVWNAPATAACGTCHSATASTGNLVGTGSHAVHFSASVGPGLDNNTGCSTCHTGSSATDNTHVNGVKNLKTAYNDNAATTLSSTNTCGPCHAGGAPQAKSNWPTGAALDCLTCHMNGSQGNARADNTGIFAPNVGGDNAAYGANYTGHNRSSGSYAGSGNPAANNPLGKAACTVCHKTSLLHINNVDDNTYSGNRLSDNVNGATGLTTVSALCAACHTNTGSATAANNKVNTHGNTSAAFKAKSTHDVNAQDFVYNCDACHEAHGMTNNGRSGSSANIFMIKPLIEVRNFSAGSDTTADNTTTVGPVYFEALTGANSFDDGATSPNTRRLCIACHVSAQRPGNTTALTNPTGDGTHVNLSDYTTNEQGKDCSSCHNHNVDDNTATVDGLMPQQCNGCHSYPGLDNSSVLYPNQRQMTLGHWQHVGKPLAGGTDNSRAFQCGVCHLNYAHNQSNVTAGGSWSAFNPANVNVRFDAARNPVNGNGPKYNGANAGPTDNAVGNGGTGVCAGLYCHGNNATLNAGWNGSAPAPRWDNVGGAPCGACHDTGASDTTPATRYSTGNHSVHLDNAGKAYGPETSQFSAGGNCAEGTGCHTKYGLTPNDNHVNGTVDFRTSLSVNTPTTLALTQVCRNCHSTYTNAGNNLPSSGDTLARTKANWDNGTYQVPCITCHNDSALAAPQSQGTVRMDGSGNKAPNILAAYYGNGHGASSIDNLSTASTPPIPCMTCHFEQGGHIGAGKTASNPWRLDNALTQYAVAGGLDNYCMTACHANASPAKHAWIRVGVGSSAKDNSTQTHPASIPSVPQNGEPAGETLDKSKWYQVTADTLMPLGGTTASPASGDLNSKPIPSRLSSAYGRLVMCVTCHDPHGVGTAPIVPRTFSGTNDNGYQMLRYKPSGATPSPLCAKCHT